MKDDTSALRGALVIVLAGTALGMTYNGMGLRSQPPRGIPWVATEAPLPSLEDLAPTDSLTGVAPAVEPPAHDLPPAGIARTEEAPATSADRTPRVPKSPAGAAPLASPPSGESPPTSSMPEPSRVAPPPFVPESDQPHQVQLGAVTRFFKARGALFVDARDPAEYEAGHIPGAIRLTNPEAQNEPERVKALPVNGRPIICYCEGGTCEASLDLARFLIESGYRKVLVYMGGYPEWAAAGHPVEKGTGK